MSPRLVRQHRRGAEQPRVWLDWWAGFGVDPDGRGFVLPARATVDEVCDAAAERGAQVVSWCGERPYGGDLDAFTEWREPAGRWAVRERGHYLRDLLAPVLRYEQADRGPVDVRAGGEWFGDHTAVSAREAYDAMAVVREVLAPRFYGARVWASPQATGTDLLLRALPEGREWVPVPDDVARHIQSVSTQGRVETFDRGPGPIPQLVEYDGRFFYAALCAELPEGEPMTGPGWPDPAALGYLYGTAPEMVRGWFDIEFRAPGGWGRAGMVPWLGERGWTWPADRRWRRGWVAGPEVERAMRWKWEVRCRRHLAWPRGRDRGPLGEWADLLVGAREQAELLTRGTTARTAAAAALRSILLTTVGVLHGRGHPVTRTAPYANGSPPAGVRWQVEGDRYVWQETAPPARPEFAHPEWSASIWSKCRARMLDGPAVRGVRTGALHVDPVTLLAFSVDALYLSADPAWPDDGRVGRLRRKALHQGPLPAPADRAELLALLRDERGEHAHA